VAGWATPQLLALAVNVLVARGAFEAAVKMYPGEKIEVRQGARVVARGRAQDRTTRATGGRVHGAGTVAIRSVKSTGAGTGRV